MKIQRGGTRPPLRGRARAVRPVHWAWKNKRSVEVMKKAAEKAMSATRTLLSTKDMENRLVEIADEARKQGVTPFSEEFREKYWREQMEALALAKRRQLFTTDDGGSDSW